MCINSLLLGNPIASLISRLNLQRSRVFLKLRDIDGSNNIAIGGEDSDSDGEAAGNKSNKARGGAGQQTTVEVEFDLTLSAFANARKMYAQRKVAQEKEARTVEASARALQHVEERTLKGVENQKLKRNLRAMRKVSIHCNRVKI